MTTPIHIISSMATKALLTDLARMFEKYAPEFVVQVESVGGVDAAKRVQDGEAFDCVVLASNAIDNLLEKGKLVQGSRTDLVISNVAVAVPEGVPHPCIDTEQALKQAVLNAQSIGYSTGPSGVQLIKLFERWSILNQVQDKLVQAQPGIPVGTLLAQGKVSLGFQQHSEMIGVSGIEILGTLPDSVQITTIFSAGIASTSKKPQAVQQLMKYWASANVEAAKLLHGLQTA